MKVSDLLVEKDSFYKPEYRSERQVKYHPVRREYTRQGIITGDQEDWLALIGAERSDIKPAMEKARQTREYDRLLAIFSEVPSPLGARNGTFVFRGLRGSLLGDERGEAVHRRIMLNGKIVAASTKRGGELTGYTSRLKSPEPATAETRPDLTPQERLVSNYQRAFGQLYKVQYPLFRKALETRLKQDRD